MMNPPIPSEPMVASEPSTHRTFHSLVNVRGSSPMTPCCDPFASRTRSV